MVTPDKYQFSRDFYLMWIDSLWESRKTKAGIITHNTATHSTTEDVDDREHRRRYGTVLEVPASFSETVVEMVDPGLPAPRKYVGHDWIQMSRNAGYRGYRDHEDAKAKYYPSTFEQYQTVTMADIGKQVHVDRGDKIYFLPGATDMERYMGPYKDGHLFSVQVNEILCSVKEVPVFEGSNKYKRSRVFPQGGWVMVEISMETWQDITTPTGIIVKVAPEALPLQGKVLHAQRKHLEGKAVLFERDADAPVTVEGKEMTCMRYEDVLATIKPK